MHPYTKTFDVYQYVASRVQIDYPISTSCLVDNSGMGKLKGLSLAEMSM